MAEVTDSTESFRKIFCGGLAINTTKETLSEYFEKFGTVSDCVVMKDSVSGRSKCFGFVTFKISDSVDSAQASRPHTVDGKQIDTKRAIPKDDPSPESRYVSQKIFVGGLKKEISKEQIKEYFNNFGNVTDVILVTDKASGQSKGFGFVTFEDSDSVDKVIIHKPHTIESSRADVKKALSKEEMEILKMKQTQNSQQYAPQQSSWPSEYGLNGSWGECQGGPYPYYDPNVSSGWNNYPQNDYSSNYVQNEWGNDSSQFGQYGHNSGRGVFRGSRGGGPMRGRGRGDKNGEAVSRGENSRGRSSRGGVRGRGSTRGAAPTPY